MKRKPEPERISLYGWDETDELIANNPGLRPWRNEIADALQSAFRKGLFHRYRFQILVNAPWGEMMVYADVCEKSYFDARRLVQEELEEWKRSQDSTNRNDFPWIDQAIAGIQLDREPVVVMRQADNPRKVDIYWYDERER